MRKIKGIRETIREVQEYREVGCEDIHVYYNQKPGVVAMFDHKVNPPLFVYEIPIPDPKVQKFTKRYLREACEATWSKWGRKNAKEIMGIDLAVIEVQENQREGNKPLKVIYRVYEGLVLALEYNERNKDYISEGLLTYEIPIPDPKVQKFTRRYLKKTCAALRKSLM